MSARIWLAATIAAGSVILSGCVGVLDRCADGLNPPAGGWDNHAPH